jgi:hypothetical protein
MLTQFIRKKHKKNTKKTQKKHKKNTKKTQKKHKKHNIEYHDTLKNII